MASKFDEQKAHRLYADKMSDRQIASALSVSASTIRRWRIQENLSAHKPPRRFTDDSQFRSLYDQGMTDSQIASVAGSSTMTITRWRQEANLPANKSIRKQKVSIDVDKIQDMLTDGLSIKQIAEQFSCSDQTIYNLCRREGFPLPTSRRKDHFKADEARKLYDDGCSDAAIAKMLNVSASIIAKWRKSENLPSNHLCLDDSEVLNLYRDGLSDPQIARKLGCSAQTVLRCRRRHDLPPNRPEQKMSGTGQPHLQVAPRRLKIDSDKARTLYDEGLSDSQMAAALGVSTGTVRNWRYRENLVAKAWKHRYAIDQSGALDSNQQDDWDREQALELWLDGLNDYEIASKLKIDPSAAEAWRLDLGLPPVPTAWSDKNPGGDGYGQTV